MFGTTESDSPSARQRRSERNAGEYTTRPSKLAKKRAISTETHQKSLVSDLTGIDRGSGKED